MNQSNPITYEFPLHESYRNILKLEYIFKTIRQKLTPITLDSLESCLHTLVQTMGFIDRAKLDHELLTLLDECKLNLERLSSTPAIDRVALSNVLVKVDRCTHQLEQFKVSNCTFLANPLYQAYTSRHALFCGTLNFDLPLLHYYAHQPIESIQTFIENCLAELAPLENAVHLILHLIRQSQYANAQVSKQGKFYASVPHANCPMIRLSLSDDCFLYPEVSYNHQCLYIRFLPAPQCEQAIPDAIPFKLTYYSLA